MRNVRKADLGREHAAALELMAIAQMVPCPYCGDLMDPANPMKRPTRSHIWPKGIRSVEEGRVGTVWCCAACTIRKGDMLPSQWLRSLIDRGLIRRKEPVSEKTSTEG